ncbi:MAG: glycoside hydrolase family 5 [Polyangiaceae bacterium]|jgi:aryl-phospho-beta-D-glucosidase BglC (GH1 family)|nr:glycoside hydrolase family 5 [Polyangiaceae bacterium]
MFYRAERRRKFLYSLVVAAQLGCASSSKSPTTAGSAPADSAGAAGNGGAAGDSSLGGAASGSMGLPWLHTEGNAFVTDESVPVRLTGLGLANQSWGQWVSGASDALAAANKDPLVRPEAQYPWALGDEDFRILQGLSLHAVRYDINYELFAPENPRQAQNLALLRAHAQRLGTLGMYMIVNLAMPIGLDNQSDGFERLKPAPERELSIFEDPSYFAATLRMWKTVAEKLADLPEVAGYELINEPRLPSDADGGLTSYRAKYQALCDAIREVDQKHVIFVPEYNSREANPGETYYDGVTQQPVVDSGEQGVIWDRHFVPVTGTNIAYVFHLYDPFEYTSAGATSFSRRTVESAIDAKVAEREQFASAPLIITEYGVNRQQTAEKRLEWIQVVHERLRANSISALYFTYKSALDPYVPASTAFGLIGQFVTHDSYVTTTQDGETLQPTILAVAQKNGFESVFTSYFKGQPSTFLSPMDNASVLAELTAFSR